MTKDNCPRRGAVVSARLTDDECAVVQQKAAELGLSVSQYVRRAVTGELEVQETAEQDITITIHRENSQWWAEVPAVSEWHGYTVWATTFDELCERLSVNLHVMGLNRERQVITFKKASAAFRCETVTTSGQRTIVLWDQPA